MSKEEITKALKNIKIRCHPKVVWDDPIDYDLDTVEKSLKALEIIKEKCVNVGTFIHLTKILKKDYEQCKALNNTFGANICETEKEFLTEEEFELLRSVLE